MKASWPATRKIIFLLIYCIGPLVSQATEFGRLSVTGLRCEHAPDPIGIDQATPNFEWRLQSQRRGVNQLAYQIRVASSIKRLKTGAIHLWDSGRVNSDQSNMIAYGGKPLRSSHRYYWTVRV